VVAHQGRETKRTGEENYLSQKKKKEYKTVNVENGFPNERKKRVPKPMGRRKRKGECEGEKEPRTCKIRTCWIEKTAGVGGNSTQIKKKEGSADRPNLSPGIESSVFPDQKTKVLAGLNYGLVTMEAGHGKIMKGLITGALKGERRPEMSRIGLRGGKTTQDIALEDQLKSRDANKKQWILTD